MAFLWIVRAVRNVYKIADAALALDCRAVDKRQQDDWYKPAHIGLFVQDVNGSGVKGISTADSSDNYAVKRTTKRQ